MLKLNSHKLTILCVQACNTVHKDYHYLEPEGRVCLQNCGYNHMYVNKIFNDIQK